MDTRHDTRSSRHPRAKQSGCLPRGRTLHLIDIENLAGADRAEAAVVAAGDAYRRSVGIRDGDHVVVGCDRTLLLAAHRAFPRARVLPGLGPDGADRRLLDWVDPAFVATHYDRVVIASGDHAFCGLVSSLRAQGVAVCVVARPGSLARSLGAAACSVITLREAHAA